ncbi:MAG: hypothetical protein ABIJ27_06850 [Candidatus Omnitrophota bacterium]
MKKLGLIFAVAFISLFCVHSAFAAVITNRTGTITITNPDGTVSIVGVNDPLPDIPSGAVIEILYGTIELAPSSGVFTIVAGNTTVTMTGGQKAKVGLDVSTGAASVTSISGTIQTETAGVQASVPSGATATISANPSTGTVTVSAQGGSVVVTNADGTTSVVTSGSTSTSSAATGSSIRTKTTTTGADDATEEPSEPEQTDASE